MSGALGTYFPPPVRAVEIPKQHGGGTRTLGVPTEPANCPVAQGS
jgi:retron-type reverse transcriptase